MNKPDGFDEALQRVLRVLEPVLNPLTHFECPKCSIRFGMDLDDVRFMEQTAELVHCPRGHELLFGYPEDQNG